LSAPLGALRKNGVFCQIGDSQHRCSRANQRRTAVFAEESRNDKLNVRRHFESRERPDTVELYVDALARNELERSYMRFYFNVLDCRFDARAARAEIVARFRAREPVFREGALHELLSAVDALDEATLLPALQAFVRTSLEISLGIARLSRGLDETLIESAFGRDIDAFADVIRERLNIDLYLENNEPSDATLWNLWVGLRLLPWSVFQDDDAETIIGAAVMRRAHRGVETSPMLHRLVRERAHLARQAADLLSEATGVATKAAYGLRTERLAVVAADTFVAEKPPKGGRARAIMLPASAAELLRDLRRERANVEGRIPTGYILRDPADGGPWAPHKVTDGFREMARKAGLVPIRARPTTRAGRRGGPDAPKVVRSQRPSAVTFHSLRHTCASLLLAQGVHPKIVQEMLGHSSVAITIGLYSHTTESLQAEAAQRLDTILRPELAVVHTTSA
jgi:integrase